MHPELNYAIAKLRHEELIGARRFRPRRAAVPVAALLPPAPRHARRGGTPPAPIVLLPPPREERDPTGHDQRVA